jgi:alkylated DNA repair dioxygenase AlkB
MARKRTASEAFTGFDTFEYVPGFLNTDDCARWYRELAALPYWEQPRFKLYGKECKMNRFTCAFSLDGTQVYRYSGTQQTTRPFADCPAVEAIVAAVNARKAPTDPPINYVLLNMYQDGNHYLSLHRDDEKGLVGPVYGISLNEAGNDPTQRRFFDIVEDDTKTKTRLPLDNGSLMIMQPEFQKHFQHGVPAQKTLKTGRINLTLRHVVSV